MEEAEDLERFVTAQARDHETARAEVAAGRKVSHWMWYIYPQLRGLGRSGRARFYGIADGEEAARYLAHPVLGPRLEEIARTILRHRDRTAESILGPVDAAKLRSSMTLFSAVPSADPVFAEVLEAFFDGRRCAETDARLAA